MSYGVYECLLSEHVMVMMMIFHMAREEIEAVAYPSDRLEACL